MAAYPFLRLFEPYGKWLSLGAALVFLARPALCRPCRRGIRISVSSSPGWRSVSKILLKKSLARHMRWLMAAALARSQQRRRDCSATGSYAPGGVIETSLAHLFGKRFPESIPRFFLSRHSFSRVPPRSLKRVAIRRPEPATCCSINWCALSTSPVSAASNNARCSWRSLSTVPTSVASSRR